MVGRAVGIEPTSEVWESLSIIRRFVGTFIKQPPTTRTGRANVRSNSVPRHQFCFFVRRTYPLTSKQVPT